MDRLHWRYRARYRRCYHTLFTYLCRVAQGVKASTIRVAVTGIITGVITLTFANGNTEVWPRIAQYSLTLLALATLDDATQIGSFILCYIPQGRQGKYGLA